MARSSLATALLLAFAAVAATALPANGGPAAASDFIRKSCRATQYPAVCVQSLASYGGTPPPHSPRELARAALSVSVDKARSASTYVGRICGPGGRGGAGAGPVRDCLENMADSVGHLRDAAQELGGNMGRAGSPGFKWHLSNVQTWCSAALTDENTCLDGLSRGVDAATRSAIRGKIVEVAQVTSNALALVNRVAPSN
uniref:Pectinesterase inhibitor domain-containing protein n=1 Tax=Oryza punctata TaxID=4537 RepID=A0A0E0LFJ6_ORYPU